jgi:hypothetical protein
VCLIVGNLENIIIILSHCYFLNVKLTLIKLNFNDKKTTIDGKEGHKSLLHVTIEIFLLHYLRLGNK